MYFSDVLPELADGKAIARNSWTDKAYVVNAALEPVDGMEPYNTLCLATFDKKIKMGWIPEYEDMFANDWHVLDEDC